VVTAADPLGTALAPIVRDLVPRARAVQLDDVLDLKIADSAVCVYQLMTLGRTRVTCRVSVLDHNDREIGTTQHSLTFTRRRRAWL
jgi:hypothetical protein